MFCSSLTSPYTPLDAVAVAINIHPLMTAPSPLTLSCWLIAARSPLTLSLADSGVVTVDTLHMYIYLFILYFILFFIFYYLILYLTGVIFNSFKNIMVFLL